eukprot:m.412612 g.412612  ORF g.412612 m.412612 type:complete len:184 (-) comp28894_c0_seq1:199-750(-)
MRTESTVGRMRSRVGIAGKSIGRCEAVREASAPWMRDVVPWTVSKILRCTQSKLEHMEEHEPGLRRFVLVHKFMASVDVDGDPDSVTVSPAGDVMPLGADPATESTPLMTEADHRPPRAASPAVHRGEHPLRRRRRLSTSGSRPSTAASTTEKMSDRPIKKRRLKRLLGDAGCFAAASSMGAK